MALDPVEAENLAKALAELERHYPTSIDPRVMAWINFAGVAGMIYGPRVFAFQMRKSNEREEKRQRPVEPQGPTAEQILSGALTTTTTQTGNYPDDNFVTSVNH